MTAQATVSSLGGRGLDIVDYLARTWGVRTDDGGLTVWAVMAAPPGRPARRCSAVASWPGAGVSAVRGW